MPITLNGTNGITYPDGLQHASGIGRLIGIRQFTTTDNGSTYTPTTGTRLVVVECMGAGGAGGGAAATSSTQLCVAYGGSPGCYGKAWFTSGFSGVTLTVGTGGASIIGATGNSGGLSSFGSLLSCAGGSGGVGGTLRSSSTTYFDRGSGLGDLMGVSGTNIIAYHLGFEGSNLFQASAAWISGGGASTLLGSGGTQVGGGNNGWNGTGYGSGGGGACNNISSAARPGGNGANGVIIVWEYA